MNDQLATELVKQLTRIADSLATMVAKQNEVKAPNLFRPIEDYPAFDWEHEIPGCKIIARDRFGPTEVSYEGHTYRRYRSSDEDVKGTDIRYRTVISGTVAEKNLVWATLVKFGEPKKVKPLSSAVREKIEERTATRQADNPAVSQPAIQAQPAQTIGVAIAPSGPLPGKATPPAPKSEPSLYEQFTALFNQALGLYGTVPPQYQPETGDKDGDWQRKIEGLRRMIANHGQQPPQRTQEEREKFVELCAQHAELVDWAKAHAVEIPAQLLIHASDEILNVEMKISTLTKLIEPHKAKAAGMRAETDQAAQSGQQMASPAAPAQLKTMLAGRARRYDAKRPANLKQRGDCVETLNNVTDRRAIPVLKYLFDCEIDQMNGAMVFALFDYLRPAKSNGMYLPTNLNAAAELMAIVRELEQVK